VGIRLERAGRHLADGLRQRLHAREEKLEMTAKAKQEIVALESEHASTQS
jgi:hypothetical protein